MEYIVSDFDKVTYDEFSRYIIENDVKVEYSNGELFYMAPTTPNHNYIQNEIYFKLRNILKECKKCRITTSDVAVRFKDNKDIHQFEPDIMVFCDNKFDGSIYTGIPKLAVEILSATTIQRDLGLKLDIYEKFEVNEYWIVNIPLQEITVYSDNIKGKYYSKIIYKTNKNIPWNNTEISTQEIFDSIKI